MKSDGALKMEHIRRNHQTAAQAIHCVKLGQATQAQRPGAQAQADFLLGLAPRRGQSVRIARLQATAREGHLSRPGVALALGATNHQHPQRTLAKLQNQRHRGAPAQALEPFARRAMAGQGTLGRL